VEIYLEPVLPAPRLLVFGPSPVARALAQLAKGLCWRVDVVDPAADRPAYPGADRVLPGPSSPEVRALAAASRDLSAVVATMGESDEESIEAALALRPQYLGVVASRRRFALLRASLQARGASAEALDSVRNPAGLDVGAVLPEELALSILAEMVQLRRARPARSAAESAASAPPEAPGEALDPVCGMTVAVATARHRADHDQRTYYFCNARCREKFLAEPARWLAGRGAEAGVR
jgi:xanthine dehydrogenase accessory factor